MSNYNIRLIDQTEETFLWEMLYHALYIPEGHEPFPKEVVRQPEIAKYVSCWGRDGDKGYVAVNATILQPVGAAWMRVFTKDNKGYGYINDGIPELSIAILPAYRNQGLGKRLLDYLINDAKKQYRAVSLSVSANNPAVRLYERFGFEVVNKSDSSLIMIRTLRQTQQIVT